VHGPAGTGCDGNPAARPTANGRRPTRTTRRGRQIEALGDNTGLTLPVKVIGLEGGHEKERLAEGRPLHPRLLHEDGLRPGPEDRLLLRQDHNLPHYNDAWEFHLARRAGTASRTPTAATPASTGEHDHQRLRPDGKGLEPDEKKREELRAKLKEYMEKTVRLKDGYLQTVTNGARFFAWHTWTGSPTTRRPAGCTGGPGRRRDHEGLPQDLLHGHRRRLRGSREGAQARHGSPGASTRAPRSGRAGAAPGPTADARHGRILHLHSDLKKTVWYVAAYNVARRLPDVIYDAVADKWEDMKPKGDWGRKESR